MKLKIKYIHDEEEKIGLIIGMSSDAYGHYLWILEDENIEVFERDRIEILRVWKNG